MDRKVKKFKSDYAGIKAKVSSIKKKLRMLKKEIKPIANAAYSLFERGDKTMYEEREGRIITPKFNGLSRMMDDLEHWMDLAENIQYAIENTL